MELKEQPRPLKARYREDPAASKITLKATGNEEDTITCSVYCTVLPTLLSPPPVETSIVRA